MNSSHPLFMPQGSVRALLALTLVVGSLVCVIQGIENASVVHALTSMAITHYFNARGKIDNGAAGSILN